MRLTRGIEGTLPILLLMQNKRLSYLTSETLVLLFTKSLTW